MNEKQVIKKLTLLKNIKPPQTLLEDMEKDLYLQVHPENTRSAIFVLRKLFIDISAEWKLHRFTSYSIAMALSVIVFLSVSSVLFSSQLHTITLYSRLTLASNQYERASIALTDTINRFDNAKSFETYSTKDISQSIALANTELSKLKLKGEKGMYTAKQCHQLYQEYLSYIKKENRSIATENKQSRSVIKSQLHTYEELAEKKLHMYNNL